MSDDRVYTVNEVVSSIDELQGRTVLIACVLQLEFEGDSIWHRPKSQCLPGYGSSLWANLDQESLRQSSTELEQFQARTVLVKATIDQNDTGHMGLWPGSVSIHSIVKANDEQST
jgi:hypothetical protein